MKSRVNLELFLDDEVSILQKHIDLLKLVDETKSITKAAEKVGISYKNAWDMLNDVNNRSKHPIIVRVSGSTKNSGSELSDFGRKLIRDYEKIKELQNNFLKEITKNGEIDEDSFFNISSLKTRLSARNQLAATITKVETGAVNSQIKASISSGEEVIATITSESEKSLNLVPNQKIILIFKAPNVIISKTDNLISTPNSIKCKISEIKIGAVNSQITLNTKSHQTIIASVTKESVMMLDLSVGADVFAIIQPNDIIVGLQ